MPISSECQKMLDTLKTTDLAQYVLLVRRAMPAGDDVCRPSGPGLPDGETSYALWP